MKKNHDVVIVGAGPSGLQAARRLAENGLDVLVLEKKSRVGESINCTGLIGAEVFEGFELPQDSILRNVQDIRLMSPAGSSLEYKHPSCFAHVVDREKFDRNIGRQARAAGAKIVTGADVFDISRAENGLLITSRTSGKGETAVRAKVAVLATGIQQDLSRKIGLGTASHYLHGAQVETEVEKDDMPTIFAGNDIAPGGFAWAVPSRPGMMKYGLITNGDARSCFQAFQKKHLGRNALSLDGKKVQYKAIAQGLMSRTAGDRILAIGEAAGQVKTTTGGGVAFGLRCAEIAARVIARSFRESPASLPALTEYEKLWKGALKTEILLGFYARKIWARMNDAHIERVFQFARTDGVIPLIKEMGEFDRHGELILALLRRFSLFGILDGVAKKIPRFN